MNQRLRNGMWCAVAILALAGQCIAAVSVEWDFTQGTQGWSGNARVEPVRSTADGLIVRTTGLDPWIEGPAVDLPAGSLVRVTVRMRCDTDGSAQIFYGRGFSAERVRTFQVFGDGRWHDYTVMIGDGLGPATRFRLDPSHDRGLTVVRFIRVEVLAQPEPPAFPKPIVPHPAASAQRLRAGALTLEHVGDRWGAFVVRAGGRQMACGYTGEMIGVQFDDRTEWLALSGGEFRVRRDGDRMLEEGVVLTDSQGGRWRISRRFDRVPGENAVRFSTTIRVDRDRHAVLLPWMTVLPGLGSFGSAKHQGLFAGLEYLGDEPSSSTADIAGPGHVRRIPEPHMITFPLMVVEHEGDYVGLIWRRSPLVAAGFDSPDRAFGSEAHALWLSGPGIGPNRMANEPAAHSPITVQADRSISAEGLIIVGQGASVVPAVQQYVRLQVLPPLPDFEGGLERGVELLAHGWLDSAANRDWLFRHAVWGESFGPARAADAAMYMRWLAGHTRDVSLRERLRDGVAKTLARLAPGDPYASGVSHIRLPAPPLWFGRVSEYVRMRRQQALSNLGRFDEAGRLAYRASAGGPDYGRTHFADHANGLGGRLVADVLQAATLCGDPDLTAQALVLLDKQTALYADTVPRGAQTWEVPLHTPDILASAHMIDAYVYGYLLSGKEEYLEQARYWAWTGVPFVYLENPTDGPVGPYATIAVLGATNWQAPVWFGQPVQWCGLVYGSALHRLADIDPGGPWRQLSRGITLAGLQMVWPESDKDRQGLLPDYFLLRQQVAEGPAINPGTVGAHLPEAYKAELIYGIQPVRSRGWIVHAPCGIRDLREAEEVVRFEVNGLGEEYNVLIAGMRAEPQVRCTPTQAPSRADAPAAEVQYDPAGWLVLKLSGPCRVSLRPR